MVRAKFTWVKSVSANVVKQVLTLSVDGVDTATELTPDVETFEVEVLENKTYGASLVAKGPKFDAPPVSAAFTTPDLSTPASPTAFTVNVEVA